MALAYMATDSSTNTIVTVDTNTDTISYPSGGIAVGNNPFGVAFTPDGLTALVCNIGSGTISVINVVNASVVHTIAVSSDNAPFAVAIGTTTNGVYAYVTIINNDKTAVDSVAVVDTASLSIVKYIALSLACYPYGIAITPDGSYVYVAINTNSSTGNGSVAIIDTSTNTLVSGSIAFTPTNYYPYGIAISSTGSPPTAYVTLSAGSNLGNVAAFPANGSTSVSISYVTVGYRPQGIAVTPDGSTVYVANEGITTMSGNASYFSTSPLPSTATDINNSHLYQALGVSVTPDGTKVYVGGFYSSNIVVISTSSHSVTTIISSTGGNAFGTFIQPNPNPFYASFQGVTSGWFGC
jgi:YVTN family beta-propeller protein